MDILKTLAQEFSVKEEQVEATVALIDEGNTIPFISRYRKEVTGGLDDTTRRDVPNARREISAHVRQCKSRARVTKVDAHNAPRRIFLYIFKSVLHFFTSQI